MLRYSLCVVSLIAALVVAPWCLMLIAMGFDQPGATWGWLHTIVAGLPVSLLAISVTSLRWARSGDFPPVMVGLALLAVDLGAIVFVWTAA